MKKTIYLIFFLLLLQLVYAEQQFEIFQGQTIDYKGVKIKLSSIGSSESLNIKVNNVSHLLIKSESLSIPGITINLVNASLSLQKATITISQTGYCINNLDCNDFKECTRDICREGTCSSIPETGCILNDECKAQLSLGNVNDVLSYCGRDNDWHPRKTAEEKCFNNVECLSNLCKNEVCTSLGEETKMAPSWILIAFGIIFILEGLFVLSPRLAKRVLKNFADNFADSSWRIFFLIELIIGIALIVWALI